VPSKCWMKPVNRVLRRHPGTDASAYPDINAVDGKWIPDEVCVNGTRIRLVEVAERGLRPR
jgi:hypothetical protein